MNNGSDVREDAQALHKEIGRALDVIQKSIMDADVPLFAAVCAMATIIHSYKKENAGAKDVLLGYEKVLEKMSQLGAPPTEVH